MAPRKEAAVYVAIETGVWADKDGREYSFFRDRTRVREGHPLLVGCPNFFIPLDEVVHHDVEQTSAGPGELRA